MLNTKFDMQQKQNVSKKHVNCLLIKPRAQTKLKAKQKI